MKRWMMMATLLLISGGVAMMAKQKVTVKATGEDISDGLDLKAVATLFGEVKDLKEFEEKLNSKDLHLCNLDLNGDGDVDYLRVLEIEDKATKHLVLIQAVLAQDVYQDVASIYVEQKDNKNVYVQVIGDEYLYGKNYVIEPVYIYRPIIFDWFWGTAWVCYTSPWYWGYWPGWYAPYPCWGCRDYWVHVHVYHYDHPRCSYRYAREAYSPATSMRNYYGRSDFANANASRSFSSRTGMSNAREWSSSTRGTTNGTSVVSNGSRDAGFTRSTYTTSMPSTAVTPTTTNNTSSYSRSGSYTGGSYSGGSYTGGSRYSTSYSGASSNSRTNSVTNSNYNSSRSSGGYSSSYSGASGGSRMSSSSSSAGSHGSSGFSTSYSGATRH